MSEVLRIEIFGRLKQFIEQQSGPGSLYESAGEYVRDLIRQDFRREEERRWNWLINQFLPGMNADESEFPAFDPEEIIQAAKKEKFTYLTAIRTAA